MDGQIPEYMPFSTIFTSILKAAFRRPFYAAPGGGAAQRSRPHRSRRRFPGLQRAGRPLPAGELGELYYFDSVRVNLGLFQHDVNVIWDLAVHDISILDHVLPAAPLAGTARPPSSRPIR